MLLIDLFNIVTEKGSYIVFYLHDGWTMELIINASRPMEAMVKVQNILGSICDVTYVEKL